MPKIKIDQLKPGMVLKSGLNNASGGRLLDAGTRLTDRHILNLKAWGVAEADIQGEQAHAESAMEPGNVDPVKRMKVEKEAQSLFRNANQDHPAVAEMMRLFTQKKLSQG